MTKQNALIEIKEFETKLPYGSKSKIARKLRTDKHNVQAVFRGLAGEKLTLRVYKKAKELFPTETEVKTKKMRRAITQSK
jgi:hypothetical protein